MFPDVSHERKGTPATKHHNVLRRGVVAGEKEGHGGSGSKGFVSDLCIGETKVGVGQAGVTEHFEGEAVINVNRSAGVIHNGAEMGVRSSVRNKEEYSLDSRC